MTKNYSDMQTALALHRFYKEALKSPCENFQWGFWGKHGVNYFTDPEEVKKYANMIAKKALKHERL